MLPVDIHSRTPLYQQVMEQILQGIAGGVYPQGGAVPSLRQTAVETGLNINTVKRAYNELEQMGVLVSLPGRGSVVCAGNAVQNAMRREAITRLEGCVLHAKLRGITLSQVKDICDKIFERRDKND
ncbi:MAG: GntR family transcriptional regulator [Oscillospiraceae bacterium]|nr:GntR family transcriptional regulator [Oscillospiraceae bacterium]